MRALSSVAAAVAAALFFGGCTVHQAEVPSVAGPSEFALSLTVQATPDSINQDGGSQSSIKITARGPNGQPIPGLVLRLDMAVNGTVADFGTLSARTVVTGSDGTATAVFTAPPRNPLGLSGTCSGLPGTCVDIIATPTSTDFTAARPQTTTIRLVPPGVILPPADTPTARFTFSPQSPAANSPVQFDASTSCGGGASTTGCTPSFNEIVRYDWDFGDGTRGSGVTVAHTYATAQTYTVTLTVTNDRQLSASVTQQVTVGAGAAPTTAAFVFSPTQPLVGDVVFFDASQSEAAPGHTLVQFNWQFGDGTTASGRTTTHAFTKAGTYNVTLTVVDEAGQSKVATNAVPVK
jgi:PKD repeat protein